jgi:hypothetical protein
VASIYISFSCCDIETDPPSIHDIFQFRYVNETLISETFWLRDTWQLVFLLCERQSSCLVVWWRSDVQRMKLDAGLTVCLLL